MSEKDDKFRKELEDKLQSLGLTEKAAKVYLDLLPRGAPTGTSKIVRATKLHGQYVYDALDELEQKGLASHMIVGKRKKFAATHPSRLEAVAEVQRRLAQETSRDLATLSGRSRAQDFEIYQGEDAFIAHEFDELHAAQEGEEWLIIGGSGDRFNEIMRESLKEFDALRAKRNITIKYIGSTEQKRELKEIKKRSGFSVRMLDNFDRSIVNTLVRPKSLSLSTYADPVLTYQVRNVEVAVSYKNFFKALWPQCQEVL